MKKRRLVSMLLVVAVSAAIIWYAHRQPPSGYARYLVRVVKRTDLHSHASYTEADFNLPWGSQDINVYGTVQPVYLENPPYTGLSAVDQQLKEGHDQAEEMLTSLKQRPQYILFDTNDVHEDFTLARHSLKVPLVIDGKTIDVYHFKFANGYGWYQRVDDGVERYGVIDDIPFSYP